MSHALRLYYPAAPSCADFWRSLGIPPRGNRLHEALRRGLPYAVFGRLADLAGLDRKALAKFAAIAPATLQRRAKAGRFNQDESDRLYRLAEVLKAATDLFEGDRDAANAWLNKPIRGLGGRRPMEMLATSAETEAVLDLIGRLEHGVFT